MKSLKFTLMFCLVISSFLGAYEVGETISLITQNKSFDICHGEDLDPNGDAIFQFSEYNGDLNGGDYNVIFLEMTASW